MVHRHATSHKNVSQNSNYDPLLFFNDVSNFTLLYKTQSIYLHMFIDQNMKLELCSTHEMWHCPANNLIKKNKKLKLESQLSSTELINRIVSRHRSRQGLQTKLNIYLLLITAWSGNEVLKFSGLLKSLEGFELQDSCIPLVICDKKKQLEVEMIILVIMNVCLLNAKRFTWIV